ncbi:MAG TPA: outer membrane lipoprotein carrier protein LolA [Prolixibacteraceae bacterium]|nr:outer membrane lipoprotein carrier protein LolA [Prolixibacteraceae bacterium]
MKQILFIAIVLLISNNLFSKTDEKAKVILDQVSEKTKNYKSITASFEFILENTEADLKEANQGNIIIQKEMFKLSISGIDIFNDGKSQYTYMKDAAEVSISEANTDENELLNPATIFTIYEHGFTYSYLGEATENGKRVHKIDLTPSEEKDFSRVILNIDSKNLQITEATMFGTDGNRYIIRIKNMDTSKVYPNSTFSFDKSKYPGVSVNDMR